MKEQTLTGLFPSQHHHYVGFKVVVQYVLGWPAFSLWLSSTWPCPSRPLHRLQADAVASLASTPSSCMSLDTELCHVFLCILIAHCCIFESFYLIHVYYCTFYLPSNEINININLTWSNEVEGTIISRRNTNISTDAVKHQDSLLVVAPLRYPILWTCKKKKQI